ncbi:hypothetical protein [Acetobacter ghanensis]|nr:hypothetical protein [Acetobacter ghanensis]
MRERCGQRKRQGVPAAMPVQGAQPNAPPEVSGGGAYSMEKGA